MPIRKIVVFLLVLLTVLPTLAQDNANTVTVTDISYDTVQQDTITNGAFYDWWRIQANAGDLMVIDMGGSDGLAPLIGLLDPSRNLVTKSKDGEVNQSVTLEYTVPADGEYTIVATRVGNESGTSTGRYALRVRRANPPTETTNNQYEDVTFACQDFEATSVLSLHFADDPRPKLGYRITVYGIDGFIPVIRLNFDVPGQDPFNICNTNADDTVGDTFTLPGEAARSITKENLSTASQLRFNGADKSGPVYVTIASKNGAAGRYVAIVDGLSISDASDTDTFEVRMGPLAKFSVLQMYMVGTQNSRLDPYMKWVAGNVECDDAGRDGCKNIPSFSKAGVVLHEGDGTTIVGDRSDAGLLLAPGNTDIMAIEAGSRANDTYGDYALFFIGELPATK